MEIAVQSQDDELYLYSSDGELLWQGAANYGYTRRYVGPADSSLSDEQHNLQVPTRLVVLDLNGDNRQELVAMKNPAGLGTIMPTVGSFVGGSIEIMTWNGVTLNGLWTTGPIGSYIATYQLDPVGTRLYIGMVTKGKGGVFSQLRSAVAGYGLVLP